MLLTTNWMSGHQIWTTQIPENTFDKILVQVLENMRRTIHAPSVEGTNIPRESLAMNDDEEAALDDLDEDMNPDKRNTQRRQDKYVEKNGELSDSDDEPEEDGPERLPRDMRRARLNYRDIMDIGRDSGVETGSGIGTPQQGSSPPDDNDDEMNLDADGIANATPSPAQAPNGSAAISGEHSPQPAVVDDEDVTMGDIDEPAAAAAPAPSAVPPQSQPQQEPTVNAGQITPPESPPPQQQPQPTASTLPATTSSEVNTSAAMINGTTTATATAASEPLQSETEAIQAKMDEEDKAIKAEEEGRMERELENAAGEARTEAVAKREDEEL